MKWKEKSTKASWKPVLEKNTKKGYIRGSNCPTKKEGPVSLLATIKSKPKAENMDIVMICKDVYCVTCCWKRAKVFVSSRRDI